MCMGMLPFYTYEIDEDDNVVVMDFNSLVDLPAHMKPFVTFSNQKARFKKDPAPRQAKNVYKISNEDERVVMGVLISAGTPIYRNDIDGEYFGIFRKDVITGIKERLMRQGLIHNMNTMHNEDAIVDGCFMTDIFQVDSKKGIAVPGPLKDQNLQDGSLIGLYKVTDDKVWADVKNGTYTGFSIEAYLSVKKGKLKTTMSKKTKLVKGRFANILQVSKWSLAVDQDSFNVGDKLTTTYQDSTGEKITNSLSSGEYTTEEGKQILVDSNGIIRLVFNKQSNMKGKNAKKGNALFRMIFGSEDDGGQEEKKFANATDLDGTVLSWEGELKEGTPIMVTVDEEMSPAPAGEYQLTFEDGTKKMVTVDDNGVVSSISDVAEMSAEEVLEQVAEVMQRVLTAQKNREVKMKEDIFKEIEARFEALQKGEKFSRKGSNAPKKTGTEGKKSLQDLLKNE